MSGEQQKQQQNQQQHQDSEAMRRLREKVREANAQSERNRLLKGGRSAA